MTDQDAIKDIAMWLEDEVLKRRMTHEEQQGLNAKVRYWWKLAQEEEQDFREAQKLAAAFRLNKKRWS